MLELEMAVKCPPRAEKRMHAMDPIIWRNAKRNAVCSVTTCATCKQLELFLAAVRFHAHGEVLK